MHLDSQYPTDSSVPHREIPYLPVHRMCFRRAGRLNSGFAGLPWGRPRFSARQEVIADGIENLGGQEARRATEEGLSARQYI